MQLINDILDLSKIEAGTLEYIKRPMNLGEVCRTIYTVHKERVKEGVTLVLDNEEEDLLIEGDQNRIMQVITNFLTNASKFTYEGEIRFGFERMDKDIRVYVKDTGIGRSYLRAFCQTELFSPRDRIRSVYLSDDYRKNRWRNRGDFRTG